MRLIRPVNSQQEGLEGKALQEHSCCCSCLPAELANTSNNKGKARGPQAPAAPTGEEASGMTIECTVAARRRFVIGGFHERIELIISLAYRKRAHQSAQFMPQSVDG